MTIQIESLTNDEIVSIRRKLKAELNRRRTKADKQLGEQFVNFLIDRLGINVRSRSRQQEIVAYRHLTINHLFTNYHITKSDIGRIFDMDHVSIMHALEAIRNRIETNDERLEEPIEKLNEIILAFNLHIAQVVGN